MSSPFEFSRRMTLGQYLPLETPIHALDARTRLLGTLFLLVSLTFAPRISGILFGLAALIGLLLAARLPLAYALRGLLPPLPFLIILALLQVFFNAGVDQPPVWWTIGSWALTPGDILLGMLLLARFSALVLLLTLASFTLSAAQLTSALHAMLQPFSRIGLPAGDIVITVQITLRFVPFLAQAAERIAKAQASRGADWDAVSGSLLARARRIAPLLVPLIVTSLRRGENLALAMESRAFGASAQRTSLGELHFQRIDAAALILCAAVAVGIVLL